MSDPREERHTLMDLVKLLRNGESVEISKELHGALSVVSIRTRMWYAETSSYHIRNFSFPEQNLQCALTDLLWNGVNRNLADIRGQTAQKEESNGQ